MIWPPTLMLESLQKILFFTRFNLFGHNHTSWSEKIELRDSCLKDLFKFRTFLEQKEDGILAGLEKVNSKNYPRIYNLTREIADELNQPMPGLCIFDEEVSDSPAYASIVGYSIFIAKGFYAGLTDAELKSLIGHEFSHFFDNRLKSVALEASAKYLPNTILVGAGTASTTLLLESSSVNSFATSPALLLASYFMAKVVLSDIENKAKNNCKENEYKADLFATRFAGKKATISMLAKVHEIGVLKSIDGANRQGISSETHPSFLKRVINVKQSLKRDYGELDKELACNRR